MNLSIITPEKTLFSGDATEVVLPGWAGEFGVLSGHEQAVSALKAGIISVTRDGTQEKFAVLDGVAEVKADGVSVLCEHAKSLHGISREDAAADLEKAKTALSQSLTLEEEETHSRAVKMAEIVNKEALLATA